METKEKDIVVQLVQYYRQWYLKRFKAEVQYSSKQAYIVEYNTMKGILNMLRGTYKSKNPTIEPNNEELMGMWQRLLEYLTEKNNFYYVSLFSIHRSYNTIIARLMRHNEKIRFGENKEKAEKMQLKLNIIQDMLNKNINKNE